MSLRIVPITWHQAQEIIVAWHRTHPYPPRGLRFCIGAVQGDVLVGILTAGRPVSRNLDDGLTLEVTRTATDGSRNANSKLYGAAAQAAKALGYGRVVTYTQEGEGGASLRAAGFTLAAKRPATKGWDRPSRPRDELGTEGVDRFLWVRVCNEDARPWLMPAVPVGAGGRQLGMFDLGSQEEAS